MIPSPLSARPEVSVVVANRNGVRTLRAALTSIRAQTLADIEIIVVDDASTDDSVTIAESVAAEDSRMRVLRRAVAGGPAAARNTALAAARGTWIAVVDSDDLIVPERLARMVAAGDRDGADIIADDLLVFHDDGATPAGRVLHGRLAAAPSWVDAAGYVESNRLFTRRPALGYLKPLFRAAALAAEGINYDERLRIAEDYDLVLRLLLTGRRLRLVPELGYFYRKHGASISHRLPPGALEAMQQADARLRVWAGERLTPLVAAALDRRLGSLRTAAAVEASIAAAKGGRFAEAIRKVAAAPAAMRVLGGIIAGKIFVRRASVAVVPQPTVCVVSRQRLVPGANGSSAYLVGLCAALRRQGLRIELVCPTPATFGRVPVLHLGELARVFDRISVNGGWRIGSRVFATDLRVCIAAVRGVVARIAARGVVARFTAKVGLRLPKHWSRPAPYAIALPWTADELFFVARHAPRQVAVVVADYAYCTQAIRFAMPGDGVSAVIMHDMLSARPAQFARVGAVDSVGVLDAAAEAELLGRADIIVAIQAAEARAIRDLLLPGHEVVVAPMAVEAVTAPQPGEGAGLFFVGSATAPNVDALQWMLREVWPRLVALYPEARLAVAGRVCDRLDGMAVPAGVRLLGLVDDLGAAYRAADVVVSPLRVGSGLKIKLIEGLAAGKAMIVSPVTLQGVEECVGDAVVVAETAEQFATAAARLLADAAARAVLAAQALNVARRSFSAEAAYAPIVVALDQRLRAIRPAVVGPAAGSAGPASLPPSLPQAAPPAWADCRQGRLRPARRPLPARHQSRSVRP